METGNKSNQKNNGQKKKPELNLREEIIKFLRVKNRVEAKKKAAQLAKMGEETESPKVDTEQKSIHNQVTDLKGESSELPK